MDLFFHAVYLVIQFETYQDRFWADKIGRYFYIQNTMHIVGE